MTIFTDSATLSSKTAPSSADIAAYIESAIISSKTTPSTTEIIAVGESNTFNTVTSVIGHDSIDDDNGFTPSNKLP